MRKHLSDLRVAVYDLFNQKSYVNNINNSIKKKK